MLEFKYLFGELKGDKHVELLKLIAKVNFDTAFPIIARLNHIVREGSLKNYSDELVFWFGSASPLIAAYEQRIDYGYDKKEQSSLRVLNIWSNLTLLQRFLEVYQSREAETGEIEDFNDTHDRLFKAYLLINELYVAKFNSQKVIKSVPNSVGLVMKMGFTMTAMLLPYHDLNHVDAADAMVSQFIKAVYFFKFVEEHLPELLAGFLKMYGVSNWIDYLKAIFPIVGHALQNNKEGLGYLTIDDNNPKAAISKKFLANLAIASQNTGFSLHDFILPRSKPLKQINPNKFLVIDNLLVYNNMYNSLFFEFKEVLKASPRFFTKGDFKGYLNDNFSESFLTKQVLDKVFSDPQYIKYSGEEIRKNHAPAFNAEPDYYARNGNDVFLFELKDTFINGDTKQSFNVEMIANELKLKLWYKETEKKGKTKEEPKALRQLQNNIRRAITDDLPFDKELDHKFLRVHPILLYIDQSLSTPGINEIVQQWFAMELSHDLILGKAQYRLELCQLQWLT